jgi:hypothetical protein
LDAANANDDIANAFIQYYQHLFITTKPNHIGSCIHAIERKFSQDMNLKLLSEFTVEEISQALNQIQPLKEPGPDGFAACFLRVMIFSQPR